MIRTLQLENFRPFERYNLEFGRTTILVGNNGVGKTSVLEAISMLSLTTSWKTDQDSEVVRWEQPFCRVQSEAQELVIQVSPYMKRIRVDGVSKRAAQVIGSFPTILFQPDDVRLLYGPPAGRRQYLDRTISQTSHSYTRAIIKLQAVLKQRNRLLRNIQEQTATENELPFWDEQLGEVREVIQVARQDFFQYLQAHIPSSFASMVPEGGEITLVYTTSPHGGTDNFVEHLQRNRMKEIAAGITLYGPHREDIHVLWDGHPAEQALSRGQSRSLLVAFKTAELGFLSERAEQQPVLLLDDIFSELDHVRRERLFQTLGNYQVIMTTTELGSVQELLGSESVVIEVGG